MSFGEEVIRSKSLSLQKSENCALGAATVGKKAGNVLINAVTMCSIIENAP